MKYPSEQELMEATARLNRWGLRLVRQALRVYVWWVEAETADRERRLKISGVVLTVAAAAASGIGVRHAHLLSAPCYLIVLLTAVTGMGAIWHIQSLPPALRWNNLSGRFAVFAGIVASSYLLVEFSPEPAAALAGAFQLQTSVLISSVWLGAAWAALFPTAEMRTPGGHLRLQTS